MSARTTTIGIIQMAMVPDAEENRRRAVRHIVDGAARGAQIICLPELFTTPYFCRTQNPALFDLAERLPGATVKQMCTLAAEKAVVLIVPVFENRAPGIYHNSAVVIDADGSILGTYRKMHIPQDPGFEEKFYFTPGDTGYRAWNTRYGRIGVLICWDQWFPEAARLTALQGAEIIFYPTAIGWLADEKASLGSDQLNAWQTVQRGHGVANGCYIAAANRIGMEEGIEFWGHSFVSDCYGQNRLQAGGTDEGCLCVDVALDEIETFRRIWPFFRDRRVDTYGPLRERMIDT